MTDEEKARWKTIFKEHSLTTEPTFYALVSVAQHWVETEVIIERAAKEEVANSTPSWTPDPDDDNSIGEFMAERELARYMHDTILVPMHRYSCVIMLYTTVERELLRLVDNLEKAQRQQNPRWKGSATLEKMVKFCEDFYGLRIAACPQYNAVKDLQKIRDCIVHCRGDVSLSKDKDYLSGQIKRSGFLGRRNGEIHIMAECVRQFLVEVWNFFTWIFNELKWRIGTHYQCDKLGGLFKKLPNSARLGCPR